MLTLMIINVNESTMFNKIFFMLKYKNSIAYSNVYIVKLKDLV